MYSTVFHFAAIIVQETGVTDYEKIIRCYYEHYGVDPESHVVQDPDDPNEGCIVPEELRPSQPPSASAS